MLPLNNIAQKNPIFIQNKTIYRLDDPQTNGIPQNITFNFKNKGFFNNYNSNLNFEIPIHISNLPRPSEIIINNGEFYNTSSGNKIVVGDSAV